MNTTFSLLILLSVFICISSSTRVYGPDAKPCEATGRMRAFVDYKKGMITGVGVEYDLSVLDTIEECEPFSPDERFCFEDTCLPERVTELEFPLLWDEKLEKQLIYNHIAVDWNAFGHPPAEIWDAPHFDNHFYTITRRERLSMIPGPCPDLSDCDAAAIATKEVNPKHFPGLEDGTWEWTGAVVPEMGDHLISPSSHPEFAGGSEDFNSTLLFGRWNGHFAFHDQMTTLRFMNYIREMKGEVCSEIPPVAEYPWAGAWPTWSCTKYVEKGKNREPVMTASLENMMYVESDSQTCSQVGSDCEACKTSCKKTCKKTCENYKDEDCVSNCKSICKSKMCSEIC